MTIALAVLLVLHGLLHALGFLKAFGLAELPQLAGPISRPWGVAWLLAGLACLAAAAALVALPRGWWAVGAVAVVLSQVVLLSSWSDARFGTLANAVVLGAVVLGFAASGPGSLRAAFEREVARGLAHAVPTPPVTEQDLAPLPAPVQRYLRLVGVVGHPRVQHLRVRFSGRMRGGPDQPWMALTADQHSFARPPTRLFSMEARRAGVPALGLHAYLDGAATMRVRLLGLVPVVDAGGPAFTATETVTLFNDMCVMAPAMLLDPAVRWEPVDDREVRASYTLAGHTIRATLLFGEDGLLRDFWSDDRPALAPDGKTFLPGRWSTPLGPYRAFGPFRLAGSAQVRYRLADADYAYGEFVLEELSYGDRPD